MMAQPVHRTAKGEIDILVRLAAGDLTLGTRL
jgi:hypothetical protein